MNSMTTIYEKHSEGHRDGESLNIETETKRKMNPCPKLCCSDETYQAGQNSLLEMSFTSSTTLNLVSIRDMVSFPRGLLEYQTAAS